MRPVSAFILGAFIALVLLDLLGQGAGGSCDPAPSGGKQSVHINASALRGKESSP
jgi:hypothetical protein